MKSSISKYLFIFILLAAFSLTAQKSGNSKPPVNKSAEKSKRQKKKKERKDYRINRKREREERKAVKAYHKRLQTKTVRKRMKKSKQKSIRYHENKREFFLKRWFSKKK